MSSADIYNYIKIDERIATGGQPTADQLRSAAADGYQAVINLAPETGENALSGEADLVRDLNLQYQNIPVAWTNPTSADFDQFCAAMEEWKSKKLLIHCAANYRVTAFYSLYAMKTLGWNAAQADEFMAQIWESRPGFKMDDAWKSFLAEVRRTIVA